MSDYLSWPDSYVLFEYGIDASQLQMALNFELVVSGQLFSVVLAIFNFFDNLWIFLIPYWNPAFSFFKIFLYPLYISDTLLISFLLNRHHNKFILNIKKQKWYFVGMGLETIKKGSILLKKMVSWDGLTENGLNNCSLSI